MKRSQRTSPRLVAVGLFGAMLIQLSSLMGCGVAIKSPPIEIQQRDSLIGAGKIVRIENTSNQLLNEIKITIEAPSGDQRTFTQDTLNGFETLELGWKKLGGWEIPLGATVKVRCKGYLGARKAVLPSERTEDS